MRQLRWAWALPTTLTSCLVAIPLITIMLAVVTGDNAAWDHIRQTVLSTYAFNTLCLMAMVGAIAGTAGVLTAWFVAATEFPGRRLLSWMLVLPLASPAYVVAYVYTDLLEPSGPVQSGLRALFDLPVGQLWFPTIRSLPGAAVVLGLVLYPYVYLLTRAGFSAQLGTQFNAARVLGATPAGAFWRVALPGVRPAVAGGLALVLMETLADFGVVEYFSVPTFSTGIYRTWIGMGEKTAALKLAGMMLLFVIALVSIESASRAGRYHNAGRADGKLNRLALSRGQGLAVMVLCGLPVIFGFLIPAAVLLLHTVQNGDQLLGRGFVVYARNSISVAATAALLATAIALLLSYVQRMNANQYLRASIRFATLGYALPGMLLAVGILGPLGAADVVITRAMGEYFGWTGGLVLSGSLIVLIYAYVVRFLTVSFNSVSSGLAMVSPAMDAAARSLGSTAFGVVRRVHFPLISHSIGAAALLVFVDVMRELPATLILRPFNFDTLATRVYRLAGDERLAEASTAALTIVLVGILPVLLINRVGGNRNRG